MTGIGMDGRKTAYSVVSGDIQEAEINMQEIFSSEAALFDATLVGSSKIQLSQVACITGKGEYNSSYEISIIVCSTDKRLHVGHLRGPKSELADNDFQYFLDSFRTD